LEMAGFDHVALLELDSWSVQTLRANRPRWNVILGDLRDFDGRPYAGVDLLAGGVPCPPFSVAGKRLGADDERDLFPEALRLVAEIQPRAVMLENVKGLLEPVFDEYRRDVDNRLRLMGYRAQWTLLHASDFGVPQLRPRAVMVALRDDSAPSFTWPAPTSERPSLVGPALVELMRSRGWKGASAWAERAMAIGPTLVGGSHKHGGPDLGPTRAREAWRRLGVDGSGLADAPPDEDFEGLPKLTVEMAATIQGFPTDWAFAGRKTAAYRQVGNAFPPPVAAAVARQIAAALSGVALVDRLHGTAV
jgi:DNA (cytosine-5)-methyltransferase 1